MNTLTSKANNTGWLIEWKGRPGIYFSPGWREGGKWEWVTIDPDEAVRFARKQDGDRAQVMFPRFDSTFFQGTEWVTTEHVWLDRSSDETGALSPGVGNLLCNVAQILDGWKLSAPQDWTEWDQQQREAITTYLRADNEQAFQPGVAGQIERAQRQIEAWPADVRVALGLPHRLKALEQREVTK